MAISITILSSVTSLNILGCWQVTQSQLWFISGHKNIQSVMSWKISDVDVKTFFMLTEPDSVKSK